jgi:mannose/fructose/N-acetylgalactosamine-specific phosphotransferase system component IID
VRASRGVPCGFSTTLTALVGSVSADLPLSGRAMGFALFLVWEGLIIVPAIAAPLGLSSLGFPATWRLRNTGTLETASLSG